MPKIMAVPEGMRNIARQIHQSSDNLWDNLISMEKIFGNLNNCFSGKVPELILQRVMQMEKSYRGFALTLDKYSMFLREMADNYELADEQAAEHINSLVQKNKRSSQWFNFN